MGAFIMDLSNVEIKINKIISDSSGDREIVMWYDESEEFSEEINNLANKLKDKLTSIKHMRFEPNIKDSQIEKITKTPEEYQKVAKEILGKSAI